jgi:hypothetical protein
MEIGIVGLPRSGKTTVFQALGGPSAHEAAARAGHNDPIVATVPVPDDRLERLAQIVRSGRVVHAMVRYTDLPGLPLEAIERAHGLPDSHIQYLGRVDALLAVIRAFDDGSGEPVRIDSDIQTVETELALTDLERVERRLEKLEKTVGKVSGKDREDAELELATLRKIHAVLNEGRPARIVELTDREDLAIRTLSLLSLKPIAWLINVDENTAGAQTELLASLESRDWGRRAAAARLNAEMEKEISELDEESRAEFLAGYGIEDPASHKILTLCFRLLGQMVFFTAGEKEANAWTIPAGAKAPQAAGAVHSDFEKGFIRAEVVAWEDLEKAGSMAAARRTGAARTEGKNYVVRDGDVMLFLFH